MSTRIPDAGAARARNAPEVSSTDDEQPVKTEKQASSEPKALPPAASLEPGVKGAPPAPPSAEVLASYGEDFEGLRKQLAGLVNHLDASKVAAGPLTPIGTKGATSIGWRVQVKGVPGKETAKPLYSKNKLLEGQDFFANALRRAAGEPALDIVEGRQFLNDKEFVKVYVRPSIQESGKPHYDVDTWTIEQQVMAANDLPWMFFLGDRDKEVNQYKMVALPNGRQAWFCADWDQSRVEQHPSKAGKGESRHMSLSGWPAVQTSLLAAAVRPESGISLEQVRKVATQTAQRIADTVTPELARAAIQKHIDNQYPKLSPAERKAKEDKIVQYVVGRAQQAPARVAKLFESLEKERAKRDDHSHGPGVAINNVRDSIEHFLGERSEGALFQLNSELLHDIHDLSEVPVYSTASPDKPVRNIRAGALEDEMGAAAEKEKAAKKADKKD
jgi:hypothetical protein